MTIINDAYEESNKPCIIQPYTQTNTAFFLKKELLTF